MVVLDQDSTYVKKFKKIVPETTSSSIIFGRISEILKYVKLLTQIYCIICDYHIFVKLGRPHSYFLWRCFSWTN